MSHLINDQKVKEIVAFLAPAFGFPAIYEEDGYKQLCETACQGAYVSTGMFVMPDMVLRPMYYKEQAERFGYSPEQAYQEWVEFIIIFCATILFLIENEPDYLNNWLNGVPYTTKEVSKRVKALRGCIRAYKRKDN